MARKRNTGLDSAGSGSASAARTKAKAAHTKHVAASTPEPAVASPSSEPVAVPVAAVYIPSHEEIAQLAFAYWEARGGQGGSPEEDWLRAEAELRVRSLRAEA